MDYLFLSCYILFSRRSSDPNSGPSGQPHIPENDVFVPVDFDWPAAFRPTRSSPPTAISLLALLGARRLAEQGFFFLTKLF